MVGLKDLILVNWLIGEMGGGGGGGLFGAKLNFNRAEEKLKLWYIKWKKKSSYLLKLRFLNHGAK